ncbi:MAG: hypothetical protein RL596_1036 [Bacteroidota bacterium]
MYKKLIFIFLCTLFVSSELQAQTKKLKVLVFAPVYLDSAFDGTTYKLGNANLPRTILPGLDFYNGIMLAVDSLNKEYQPLDIYFFDTKSITEPMEVILDKEEVQDASLVIAAFNNRNEIKDIADFALQKKIPLISMTYPNDGGISANPFFALVNPTLRTHIEAIYTYLGRIYPTEQIVYFRRAGSTEDMIAGIMSELNKKTYKIPLKIKTVSLPDSFTIEQVLTQLDSNKQNIVVCGTLNEVFGMNLTKAIGNNKKYKAIIIGSPTWDAIKDIGKDAEIIYTTPYNYQRTDKTAQSITNNYRAIYAGRPSDMVFKAFEAMYRFGKLLVRYGNNTINHLSDKDLKLFNEFDFQPVRAKKESSLPDYLENKKLYFVKKVDGQIKTIQ